MERLFGRMKIKIRRRNRPVMPIRLSPMRPPSSDRLLQPLREVGLLDKTQPWSTDEIHAALREAHLRGISPESLYGTATQPIS